MKQEKEIKRNDFTDEYDEIPVEEESKMTIIIGNQSKSLQKVQIIAGFSIPKFKL